MERLFKGVKTLGKLELISFVVGFGLLTFELAAARILAPTIGSSTYVWTSVIGVIIAALSVGYFVGGKLADLRNRMGDISYLLVAASFAVAFTLGSYPDILSSVITWSHDARIQAVIAALILFAPASFIMGMISPYLAKLNVTSLTSSGSSVASLSALNSVGGIAGTFITGFILFGYIGSRETIALVSVLLLIVSWLLLPRLRLIQRIGATLIVCIMIVLALLGVRSTAVSIDTASAHYEISDLFYDNTPVRALRTGPSGIQSAVALSGSHQPVFWYTSELARITLEKQPKSILILGGGAFTLPQYLAEKLPHTNIDVVEIDPELKPISEKYFGYTNPSNVHLIFTDARTYINQTSSSYDVIIADVYGDASIPFSLITKEYGQSVAQRLNKEGVVLANIIGGLSGSCKDVLDAANAAYTVDLPYASYVLNPQGDVDRANIIALYSRDPQQRYGLTPISADPSRGYSDNYSPSERLYYQCQTATR